jgi:ABC-type multidrug transport system ATPase subunit
MSLANESKSATDPADMLVDAAIIDVDVESSPESPTNSTNDVKEQDEFKPPTLRQASTPAGQFRLEYSNIAYALKPDKKAKRAAVNGEVPVGKTLIHPISGVVEPGRMLAIMGSSGAGKSTLLDLLAGRIASKSYSGAITLNGKAYPPGQYRRLSTYVMQDDALYPLLTVRETFRYAARLRVGDHKGKAYLEELVTETIELLGLDKCADTIIGDDLHRGVSGGEKRRVTIGCEIISSPAIIYLDEPTSGLDSTTALQVVETLKNLCRKGRTVIVTVHQPSMRVFQSFDDVLFLNDGKAVYYGPVDDLVDYTKSKGGVVPPYANVPELFLELVDEAEKDGRVDDLLVSTTAWEGADEKINHADKDDSTVANNFIVETKILMHRSLLNMVRTKELFFARVGLCVVMGLVLGSLFFDAPDNVEGARERTSFSAFAVAFFIFTSLEALPIFLQERSIVTRESSRGAYRPSTYTLASAVVVIPFFFIMSLVFSSISFFMVGVSLDAGDFFLWVLTIASVLLVGNAIAVFVSGVAPDALIGNTMGTAFFAFQFLFSGFFIVQDEIPDGWIWVHYLSAFKYASESLMIIALDENLPSDMATLQAFGIDDVSVWRGIGVLVGMAVIYRIFFYIALRVKHTGARK